MACECLNQLVLVNERLKDVIANGHTQDRLARGTCLCVVKCFDCRVVNLNHDCLVCVVCVMNGDSGVVAGCLLSPVACQSLTIPVMMATIATMKIVVVIVFPFALVALYARIITSSCRFVNPYRGQFQNFWKVFLPYQSALPKAAS